MKLLVVIVLLNEQRSDKSLFYQVAFLHGIVGSLLLGIVILVVGLVQLSPGAEAAQHRYYLMGAGGLLVTLGVLGAVLRSDIMTH